MKDDFVRHVLGDAGEFLDTAQVNSLSNVLYTYLQNYTLTPAVECSLPAISDLAAANAKPYSMFFVAKKIEGLSDKSLKYYKSEIDKFMRALPLPLFDIVTDDIRYYLAQKQGVSKTTVNNVRRILSSFFTWLHAEEYISKNPMLKIKLIKQDKIIKKAFTEDEIELLRDACQTIRELAVIDTFLSTGMRAGELHGCDRKSVNFQEGEVLVFGKGNKERICYLNARAKKHLRDYLDTRIDDAECLILNQRGMRLGISGIEIMVRNVGKRAGVTTTHPHRFRRTAATLALNRGMPVDQVRLMLGHEQMATTMMYAQTAQCNVKQAHSQYLG